MTDSKKTKAKKDLTRRTFLGSLAAGTASLTVIPRHVLGSTAAAGLAPSEKLNIAGVGVGGMGGSNVRNVAKANNIVALCDVDAKYAAGTFKKYPKAKTFVDYRIMLDKMKDIDGVIVATPDHTHAMIAMEAMRQGKHVYVQKPLARSVTEARTLTEAARKYKVATQMGNQGHSGEGGRLITEWIQAGAIGPVREVHAWTNRPVWPQNLMRPTEIVPVPETLDWDKWLGPAPERPYSPIYLPWNWRAWRDFGTGALGDMACHILDPVQWALDLKYAESVEACVAKDCKEKWKPFVSEDSYPLSTMVYFQFPARGKMPPVKVTWYDGGLMPRRPDAMEPNRQLGDKDGGVLFIGDDGIIMCGCYGRNPRLVPETSMKKFAKNRPEKTIPRIEGGEDGHEADWIRACKGGKPASSNFDNSGPLTEMVVMGNLAINHPGKKLMWDGDAMRVTNFEEANKWVNPPYRKGWHL